MGLTKVYNGCDARQSITKTYFLTHVMQNCIYYLANELYTLNRQSLKSNFAMHMHHCVNSAS